MSQQHKPNVLTKAKSLSAFIHLRSKRHCKVGGVYSGLYFGLNSTGDERKNPQSNTAVQTDFRTSDEITENDV